MNNLKRLFVCFSLLSIIYSNCLGDLNEDYAVDIHDIIIIINVIIYEDQNSNVHADLNSDSDINILDIIYILNIILHQNQNCNLPIEISYNIHESLPDEWIEEFYIIMGNLENIVPAYQNHFTELNIYAWNSNTEDPYIGIQGGTYIGGSSNGLNMVLEINDMEFQWNHMHRYSVIAHEYFHVYQLSINEPMNEPNGGFNPNTFSIKWLIEGSATVFESMYIQEYYNYNYFSNELIYANINNEVHMNPHIFESYNSNNIDINYTSSVFMVLVLAKELIESGYSEEHSFRMIFKDFMLTGAENSDWEIYFEETFELSVSQFYNILQSYPLNISNVLPSESLYLNEIFN